MWQIVNQYCNSFSLRDIKIYTPTLAESKHKITFIVNVTPQMAETFMRQIQSHLWVILALKKHTKRLYSLLTQLYIKSQSTRHDINKIATQQWRYCV